MTKKSKYKRILLKISGESLLGKRKYGIEPKAALEIAAQIKEVLDSGVETAVVVGGGNIFRGLSAAQKGMDRATGDYIGMLATVINGLALQEAVEKIGVDSRLLTAIAIEQVAEPFVRRRSIRHMEKGRLVILAGGTGSPYFTTDTCAALRALELGCEAILKATKVDGVYDKDPLKYKGAKMFKNLSYIDVLSDKNIQVLDSSATSLCMDNKIPIVVFNLFKKGNLRKVVLGEKIGTVIF